MKLFNQDTIITAGQKRKEAILLLICFVLANLLNLTGILIYKTSFTELYSQLGIVLVISLLLYGLTVLFRLILFLAGKIKTSKH